MSEDGAPPVVIALTREQINDVLIDAAENGSPSVFALFGPGDAGLVLPSALLSKAVSSGRLSGSLLRGLAVFACFDVDGGERPIIEVARELGMTPSAVHRYASTLRAVGLLDHSAQTRKYSVAGQWRHGTEG